jgi:hypothetical protein
LFLNVSNMFEEERTLNNLFIPTISIFRVTDFWLWQRALLEVR